MIALRISSLWRGDVPLVRVFWDYAIAWGTLLNLLCTGAALVAFFNGFIALGLLLHFAAVPYNVLMLVSVFRAAEKETGLPLSNFTRIGIVIWFVVMFFI